MNLTFGERLKDIMENKGISQKELCIKTGISTTTLSNAMNGISKSEYNKDQGVVMKCNNLVKICKVLNVSSDYLLGLSDVSDIGNYELNSISLSTGLSGESIKKLMEYKEKDTKHHKESLEAINILLQHGDYLLSSLYEYLSIYACGESWGKLDYSSYKDTSISDYDIKKVRLLELIDEIQGLKAHLEMNFKDKYIKNKIEELEQRLANDENLTSDETNEIYKLIKKLKNNDDDSLFVIKIPD